MKWIILLLTLTSVASAQNWKQVFTNPTACPYIHGFAIRTTNGEFYIACHTNLGAYKSTDQGQTWTSILPSQVTSGQIWSIQINPNNGSVVLQTQGGGSIGGKTYISTNDGTSWTLVSPTPNPPGWTGVGSGSHSGCVFGSAGVMSCGAYNGQANLIPWSSTNNGVNASLPSSYTGGTNQSVYGLGINPVDQCIFVGGEASGTYRTCDYKNYTLVFACLSSCSGTNGNVTSFAFDGSGNPYEAAQGGVYKGTGSGNNLSWVKAFGFGGQTNALITDGTNFYVSVSPNGTHAEYIITNGGTKSAPFDTGLPTGDPQGISPVIYNGAFYQVFFQDASNTGLVYSTPISSGGTPPNSPTSLSGKAN